MTKSFHSIVAACILALSLVGCEKYDYVSYEKQEKAEKKMMADFYTSEFFTELVNKAAKTDAGLPDTIDYRDSEGLGYFIAFYNRGIGAKIETGKEVGIRYTDYGLGYGSGGKISLIDISKPAGTNNNYSDLNPKTWTAGFGSERALDIAVSQMNKYGKAIVVTPSKYWEVQDYYNHVMNKIKVYDFEITYLGK